MKVCIPYTGFREVRYDTGFALTPFPSINVKSGEREREREGGGEGAPLDISTKASGRSHELQQLQGNQVTNPHMKQ